MSQNSLVNRHWVAVCLLTLVALFSLYQLLFLHFRPYDIDNPWFLSFSYSQNVRHVFSDEFLHARFPYGQDGTQFFGWVAAELQAVVAKLFGWQQRPMAVLSSLAVVSALGMWAWSLRRMGHATNLILAFLIVAGTAEPYIAAANRFRYEPLSILLVSGGLLLGTYDLAFLSILVAASAMETQPSALLGLVPVLIYNITRHDMVGKLVLRAAAALTIAATGTLLLHPQLWHLLRFGPAAAGAAPVQIIAADHSGFISYFLYLRHLPETLFLAITPWVFLFRGKRPPREMAWIAWSALAAACFAIASPHPNVIYSIFFYPFLLLLALLWFSERKLVWIAVAFLANATLQLTYLAYLNRGQGYRENDMRRVSAIIQSGEQEIRMSDREVRIFGDYTVWFAHPNNFIPASYANAGLASQSDLLLCYRQLPSGASQPKLMNCDAVLKLLPSTRLLSEVTLRGNILLLYTPHPQAR